MRTFEDDGGHRWVAAVAERPGYDYKGRFYLRLLPEGDDREEAAISMKDIRWNSLRTAQRTLETMSVVELRRRLRQARGRVSSRLTVPE